MIDSTTFYASFDKAGFLKTALWTPSSGLPGAGVQQSAQVKFRAPNKDALAGDVSVTDYSIKYPSTILVGLRRGEVLTIDGATFRVREGPDSELDGSVQQVYLTKTS